MTQERTNRAVTCYAACSTNACGDRQSLASTLAVISGLLAFSFTGMCSGDRFALMFPDQADHWATVADPRWRVQGRSAKEYRERRPPRLKALKVETAAEETRRRLEREGVTDELINAAIKQAVADARSEQKASIWGQV